MEVFSGGHSAVNDTGSPTVYDQLSDYDYPTLPAVETVYSELENESSPSPSATGSSPIETGGYSGLEPSTRELPVVYDEMGHNEYSNNEETSTPAVETVYSERENESPPSPSATGMPPVEAGYTGLEPSTREPPVVYDEMRQNDYVNDKLTGPDYVNTGSNGRNTASELTGGDPRGHGDDSRSDHDMSADINGSSGPPYSQLESSTRDQQPPPVYDRLARHDYVND